jgi:hypothetical protein
MRIRSIRAGSRRLLARRKWQLGELRYRRRRNLSKWPPLRKVFEVLFDMRAWI